MAFIPKLLEMTDMKEEVGQSQKEQELRHMVRQSELDQPGGCMEVSLAGGRLGIPFHQ